MEISLDDNKLSLIHTPDNLEEVIQEIMDSYLTDGRSIWTVELNGEQYNENAPNDAQNVFIDSIRTLKIATKNKQEIILYFLENSGDILETIDKSAILISEFLRTADVQEANKHYLLFLESYQYFYQMIQQCIDMIDPDLQKIIIKGGSVDKKVSALENLFNKMISTQTDEDWPTLADLLEYELVPLFREWGELLPVLEKMQ